jgi:hypothetical protein
MIRGGKHKELTAETILELISAYDIYRYYYGRDFVSGEGLLSPFRKEDIASFAIRFSRNEAQWLHTDYANTMYSGNCFQFVQQLFTISYNEALEKIDNDFQLGIRSKKGNYKKVIETYQRQSIYSKRHTVIQVKVRKWKEEELEYWRGVGVEREDFRQVDFSVYAPEEIWVNQKRWNNKYMKFCYLFQGKYWKIYSPFAPKEEKWISNVPGDLMYGMDNIRSCRKAIITKSVKDLLALKKIYHCVGGCQSESIAAISEENIKYLRENCEEVYIAFDSDEPGKRHSWYYTENFNFKHLNTPDSLLQLGIKDFSGWINIQGQEVVKEFLKQKGIL